MSTNAINTEEEYGKQVVARLQQKFLAEAYINCPHVWSPTDGINASVQCFFPTVSKEPDDLFAVCAWDIDAEAGKEIFGTIRNKRDYTWHAWGPNHTFLGSFPMEIDAVQVLVDNYAANIR